MNINSVVSNLIDVIVTGCIGLLTAFIMYYIAVAKNELKARTKSIQDASTRTVVDSVIDKLSDLIDINVESAQETIVKELKAKSVDGNLTVEDGKSVLNIVKTNILSQLSDTSKQTLSNIIGDLEGYIENKIEVSLKYLKEKTNDVAVNQNDTTIKTTETITTDDISSEEDVVATQER